MWGFWEGLRHPDGTTGRLRINSVLNSMTRRGPFLGNSMGVLGTRCWASAWASAKQRELVPRSLRARILFVWNCGNRRRQR